MKFSVDKKIFKKFPEYLVGVVMVTGIDNSKSQKETFKLLKKAAARKKLKKTPIDQILHIKAWRAAFKKTNISPDEFTPSAEAFLNRIAEGKDIPNINPVINIINAIAIKHAISVGGHDLDRTQGNIQVRVSKAADSFMPMESATREKVEREIVYADEEEILTRKWVWRQGEKSKTDLKTRNIFIPIDALPPVDEDKLQQIMDDLCGFITSLLGGKTEIFIINKNSPEITLPILTKKVKKKKIDKIDELLTRRVEKIYPSKGALEKVLRSGKKIKLYLGIDPSGGNLHLGHAIPLMKLQEFVNLEHHVIFLVGNFTALCGDPSGHEGTRKRLTSKQIEKNMATYKKQASKILDFSKVEMKYNADWLAELTFAEIINLASHFTVQQIIERDLFQRRIKDKKPIFLHEFLYPLLQGYDAVAMDVNLEVGGTDQTFNMLAGRTLQKIYNKKEMFVLTTKMMMGLDGKTMSKTSGNTVNIFDNPDDMYGKLMSLHDDLIIQYFELCTEVPLRLIKEHKKALRLNKVNPMDLKKQLAFEIVKMYHNAKDAKLAEKEFERVFQKGKKPTKLPSYQATKKKYSIIDLLVKTGLVPSKSEAKRLVEQGGVDVDGVKVSSVKSQVSVRDGMIIRAGKHRFIKITSF